ncbi:MAG: hypothetical protein KJ645_03595 [Planctomycetes bacterium]|nr:hypothetical protein [Planctomycetota bacterium]
MNYDNFFNPEKEEKEAKRIFRFAGKEYDRQEWKRVVSSSLDRRLRHHKEENSTLPPKVAVALAEVEKRHRESD